ncbi:hypothetical protein [Brevibacillus borstelensis]|uniref:hypothetical protein n=1 Tax=Brevibacillus borstelensis TaxID=45462 RepID=UPI00287FA4D8|nr:hypothetical protein [Brevibacillus borstelensis]WNF07444.1 hypothetical protein RFB14_08565 [Brevibacillus borstelensis]
MMTTIDGVQYREVARKAQVGEKIKIVDADSPFRTYKDGDVFTVKSVFTDECCVKEHGTIVFHSEYVVLEPVAPADIIVHDGKQYRKVDRPVREGDALVIPKLRRYTIDLTSGKVYALGRDSAGGAYFYDDVEDARYNPIRENDVYVLEPVAPQTAQSALSALETELAATKAKVAEMEAQLAAARDAAFDQFSAGEKVRLVSGGGAYPLLGFENGRVYTVRNPKHTGRSDGQSKRPNR